MNERIQQLAKEYGLVRWDHDSLSYELRGDIEDLLEFAELIVRECLSYAKEGDLDFMKFMIKQNFGVEE